MGTLSAIHSWLRRPARRRARRPRLDLELLERREVLDAGLGLIPGLTDTPTNRFVTSLYANLLHRVPQPAEVASWVNALDAGLSPQAVAYDFTQSAEYQTDLVTNDYARFLGRTATADEVAGWVQHLQAGLSEQALAADFLGSEEYWLDHGSNVTSWLNSVYEDVLGRAVDPSGLAAWTGWLQQGAPLEAPAYGVVSSQEAAIDLVTAVYNQLLDRNPDPTGLTAFVSGLEAGLTPDQFVAQVASSAEYMQDQAIAPPIHADSTGDTSTSAVPTSPQILLTPSVLATLRQQAAANTPQWQGFKAQLDSNLNQVINGWESWGLPWIADYALGYQALETSDPVTADAYADKAIAILESGLNDYQDGSWMTRQFLAQGDGVTTSFTLPNSDVVASSLQVYLSPVTTQAVVRGAAHTQDVVDNDQKILKVSNTPDGSAAYTEGVDWQRNPDLPENEIDWSLPGNEPAPGATYYVTETSPYNAQAVGGYTLNGDTITFTTAPAASQAVFVEYVYGTHAADYSTLAYQQTGFGDGGFHSIFVDDTYTSRNLGKYIALGYDWLYDYPGLTPALKSQAADLLVRWSDYVAANGYYNNSIESNYGAGGYVSAMFTALALSGGRDPNGPRLLSAVTSYRQNVVLPQLEGPGASLQGGFWAEGWNYGSLAVQNILLAGLAYEDAGLGTADAERQWSSQVIDSLISEQPTPATIYDGGDWYQSPAPVPDKDLFYLLAATSTDPTAQGYANYVIQNEPGAESYDFEDMLFHNPSAPGQFWSAFPLQYEAQGTGLVTARADWSYDSTWMSFQLGNLLACDHQTWSPGQLQIQRGGDDLLVNANAVGGNMNPNTESSYANVVAINDNGAGLQTYPWTMGTWYGSPGVELTNYEATANYVYVGGDYQAAYSPINDPGSGGPCTQLTREVVYLRPDYIVVFDRAATVQASFAKQLQWQVLNAPTVSGNSWVESVGSSKLFAQTFSTAPLTTTVSPVTDGSATVYRVATNNAEPSLGVRYVTAFQTAPSTTAGMVATQQIVSSDGRMQGVEMGNQVVLFGTDGPLNPFSGSIAYTVSGSGPVSHLLTDLEPGRTYQVQANGVVVATVTASSQGTLSFTTNVAGTQNIVVS